MTEEAPTIYRMIDYEYDDEYEFDTAFDLGDWLTIDDDSNDLDVILPATDDEDDEDDNDDESGFFSHSLHLCSKPRDKDRDRGRESVSSMLTLRGAVASFLPRSLATSVLSIDTSFATLHTPPPSPTSPINPLDEISFNLKRPGVKLDQTKIQEIIFLRERVKLLKGAQADYHKFSLLNSAVYNCRVWGTGWTEDDPGKEFSHATTVFETPSYSVTKRRLMVASRKVRRRALSRRSKRAASSRSA